MRNFLIVLFIGAATTLALLKFAPDLLSKKPQDNSHNEVFGSSDDGIRRAEPNKKLDPSAIDKSKTRTLIEKVDYSLTLYEGEKALKTYPCVFGFNPADDKQMQGDGCTPEGVFKIKAMYDHKSWSKFMWIDYPNDASWEKFKRRKADGIIPESAKIGGEIGIHGVPPGNDEAIDDQVNWTLGCIALKTKHILELYKLVKVGTEVEIIQ